jgi:putative PIN family toxin of toxin-antitoxin system
VRLVVDTNILISALLTDVSLPAHLIVLWRESRLDLLTSVGQLDELMRVTRYPKVHERLAPALAGRLINELRDVAVVVEKPIRRYRLLRSRRQPSVGGSGCRCGRFSCTGDKRHLLGLKLYAGTKIITVRDFLVLHRRLPYGKCGGMGDRLSACYQVGNSMVRQ